MKEMDSVLITLLVEGIWFIYCNFNGFLVPSSYQRGNYPDVLGHYKTTLVSHRNMPSQAQTLFTTFIIKLVLERVRNYPIFNRKISFQYWKSLTLRHRGYRWVTISTLCCQGIINKYYISKTAKYFLSINAAVLNWIRIQQESAWKTHTPLQNSACCRTQLKRFITQESAQTTYSLLDEILQALSGQSK